MVSRDAVRLSIFAASVALALLIAFSGCTGGAAAAGGADAGVAGGPDADAPAAGIRPSGRFPVGTALYEAVDRRRPEPQTADPDDRRTVVFRSWYPAGNSADLPTAPYFLNALEGRLNAQRLALPDDAFAALPTQAVRDAPVAPGDARFPVVIFSPGKDIPAALYSYLLEDLASHGYVVFAVSHPFGSGVVVFADGRIAAPTGEVSASQSRDEVILTWSADQRFVLEAIEELNAPLSLDRLSRRLDTRRLGVFGHSLGGAAAAHSCLEDLRFRLCGDLDGGVGREVLDTPLSQPFLLMRAAGADDPESTLVPFFERLAGIAYRVQLHGAGHNTFSDIAAVASRLRLDGVPVDAGDLLLGSLSAERGFQLVSRHLVAFFETHLHRGNSPLLQSPSSYPEVTLELRDGRDGRD